MTPTRDVTLGVTIAVTIAVTIVATGKDAPWVFLAGAILTAVFLPVGWLALRIHEALTKAAEARAEFDRLNRKDHRGEGSE